MCVELSRILFQYRSFIHGLPTPGKENNCPPTAQKFVKDDFIQDGAMIDSMEIDFPEPSEVQGACKSPVGEATKKSSQNVRIQQSFEEALPCHSEDQVTQRFGPIKVSLGHRMARKRKMSRNPNLMEKIKDKSRYQPLWSQQMKQFQNHLIDVSVPEAYKEWFNYFFNPRNPAKSTFGCWLCWFFRHLTQFRESHYSKMATGTGILHSTKAENHRAIKNHATSVIHLRTYEEAAKYELFDMDDDTIINMKPEDNPMIGPTNNVVEMIIQESKMNIPGNKHPMMFDYVRRYESSCMNSKYDSTRYHGGTQGV